MTKQTLNEIVLAVVAALLLAACTGGKDPSSSPLPPPPVRSSSTGAPSTPTPIHTAPSPSPLLKTTGPDVKPGERPPVLPAAATQNTQAGGEAFIRYYLAVVSWSFKTLDTQALRSLYLSTCGEPCTSQTEGIEGVARNQQHLVGCAYQLTEISIAPNDRRFGAGYAFDAVDTRPPCSLYKGATKSYAYPAQPEHTRWYLKWTGSGWVLVDHALITTVVHP